MAHYIDADSLRAELEKRLKNVHDYMNGAGMKYKGPKYFKAQGKESVYDAILNIIASLKQEQPDFPPINPDDAMKELDEKIALVKQRGTWDGVDVDKYMDEVRGREPEKPMELEEEINRYFNTWQNVLCEEDCCNEGGFCCVLNDELKPVSLFHCRKIARHFAEWGYLRAAEKYNEIEYNRQRAEDSVPNDIEKAAGYYAVDNASYWQEDEEKEIYSDADKLKSAFIAGAKWGAEHLK